MFGCLDVWLFGCLVIRLFGWFLSLAGCLVVLLVSLFGWMFVGYLVGF